MNRKEFIEIIRIHFKWLEQQGYEFSHIETSICYLRQCGDSRLSIKFHWGEYNDILIFGIFALKGFNNIEKIIRDLSGDNKADTIIKRWNKAENHEDRKTISIKNNVDVESFSKTVEDFYLNEAIPFFNEFSDSQKIANWLEANTKHSDLLVIDRNTQMLRTLVIYKECGSSKFRDLYVSYESFLRSQYLDKKSPYEDMYKVFLRFKPYFEKEL